MRSPVGFRPVHSQYRLANGLTVLLAPRKESPTASVWVWFGVGSKNERPGITGVSHWVEHMLFEGSPKYPKGAIDKAVTAVGGVNNAFTEYDFTAYFTTVPRQHLSIPLDIEADRMTRARLTPAEVERERVVILSEREGNENWPDFLVEEELYALAFRHHPYRWDPLGRPEDIRGLTAQQLSEYYHRFYGPRNATLVVTGSFDQSTVRREIHRRFGRLPSVGVDPEVREAESAQRGERRSTLTGPGTTPSVAVAWRAPPWGDPLTAPAMLLDAILGGEARLFSAGSGWGRGAEHPSARLYRRLVDTGLAIHAGSEYRPKAHPGLFAIHAQSARGVSADRIEEGLLGEIDRLRSRSPSSKEMREAREKIARGAATAYEGATMTGFRLGYFATVARGWTEQSLLDELLRCTAAQVREAAEKLFQDQARTVVRYEPTGAGSSD